MTDSVDPNNEHNNLPYYAAMFQGKELLINVKVDAMKTAPDEPYGFIVLIWVKYKEYEWLINLEDQSIEYKNDAEQLTDVKPFEFKGDDVRKEGRHHIIYLIHTPLVTIKAMSKNRVLKTDFTPEFYKKYKTFNKCYGALVSKEKLRYLSNLYEVIN